MKEIAKNIKQQRERLNYTQEYMAFELDISQPAYSKIESARTEVTFNQLVKISRILKVDIADLIRDNSQPNTQKHLEERIEKLEMEMQDFKKMLRSLLIENSFQ